jgi:nitroimidazol reductase NimA-like FMN-containing flavoprotein (pyridoxamine 5'-phosphate oxidase superfamily)
MTTDTAITLGTKQESTREAPPAETLEVTARTRLERRPKRGSHERAVIEAILDEALLSHLGVVHDGMPSVIPFAHVRMGDEVYLHGSQKNRVLHALSQGAAACLTVSLLDGLVFSRSAFHHSMNYRSVVIYGVGREVTCVEEKRRSFEALVEHMAKGRMQGTRAPSDAELLATLVVALPITEASAKIRKGPPLDSESELGEPYWAGELPLRLQALPAVPDPRLRAGIALPASLALCSEP